MDDEVAPYETEEFREMLRKVRETTPDMIAQDILSVGDREVSYSEGIRDIVGQWTNMIVGVPPMPDTMEVETSDGRVYDLKGPFTFELNVNDAEEFYPQLTFSYEDYEPEEVVEPVSEHSLPDTVDDIFREHLTKLREIYPDGIMEDFISSQPMRGVAGEKPLVFVLVTKTE